MYKNHLEAFVKNSKNHMNLYSTKISINNFKDIYNDKNYQSCNICNGSGFVKNFVNEIYKLNFENKDLNKNNLETNKNLAPYKTCLICHGTGKKDYDAVFYHTCCLNKNKSLIK